VLARGSDLKQSVSCLFLGRLGEINTKHQHNLPSRREAAAGLFMERAAHSNRGRFTVVPPVTWTELYPSYWDQDISSEVFTGSSIVCPKLYVEITERVNK